ncbi:c-type cytochrome [Aquariibacter albus]|uniref:C-type cytochrome n=1 Tax=Aquariibacter albus TaxID=2759899 RepID=A0A839HKW9_9BURK|nr:c-type cytochrome [Aquariibacter albus]MBB1162486.1 c-type cytochrome [Aquariibacter albus]
MSPFRSACAGRRLLAGIALAAAGLGAAQAQSPEAARLHLRSLAATCANCHGTDGHAVPGESMVHLAGLGKGYIVEQLTAFRDGKRPATVMHQLSKGYTDAQIDALAGYFAAQQPK